MRKRWVLTNRTKNDLLEQLLDNRGVIDHEAFLNPDYNLLYEPTAILNMDRLVSRIKKAISKKERIGIFGDYDHDGTPAAALLADGMSRLGAQIEIVYIPTREEGYSIRESVVDQFKTLGVTLLITVDCGITNKQELDYAHNLGIDTIVIDHHVVQADKFPSHAIVINPKQPGDSYPFKELCACGLAFKTIQALGQETGQIKPGELKWYLDLVAISTVCDMMPLVSENRILVHYGLLVLRQTKRLGLRKLLEVAAIEPQSISTYTVGFAIGPRLNAPGRMEKASIAYDLLVAGTEEEATRLARRLNELNKKRQEELASTLEHADAMVLSDELNKKKVILVAGDGWSDGLVGLVAGRLMDRYARPTLVLTTQPGGLVKGSARSIEGFHLVEVLQSCESHLVKYGGHAKAAGLSLRKESLKVFYDSLIEIAEDKLSDDSLKPKIVIDSYLLPNELSIKTAKRLAKLEPYGLDNPRPIFMIPASSVIEVRKIGTDQKHLKLKCRLSSVIFDAVAFGMADRFSECQVGALLDLVGTLDINVWQNRASVQLKILDWRVAETIKVE